MIIFPFEVGVEIHLDKQKELKWVFTEIGNGNQRML